MQLAACCWARRRWWRLRQMMVQLALVALLASVQTAVSINDGGFPNGVLTSVRGWRSWNAVMEDVTQAFITRQVVALTVRRTTVGGKPTSLLDLGYNRVGIDAGWNLCTGVNGSWHDASGHFLIDKSRFPDMKAMTAHAHSLGVKMDFYLNQDGLCPEGRIPGASAKTGNPHYKNDAEDAAKLGFDGEGQPHAFTPPQSSVCAACSAHHASVSLVAGRQVSSSTPGAATIT
jgi:hypothetical protein